MGWDSPFPLLENAMSEGKVKVNDVEVLVPAGVQELNKRPNHLVSEEWSR